MDCLTLDFEADTEKASVVGKKEISYDRMFRSETYIRNFTETLRDSEILAQDFAERSKRFNKVLKDALDDFQLRLETQQVDTQELELSPSEVESDSEDGEAAR